MTPLHLSLLQMDLAWHDPQANCQRAEALLRQVPQGTHLVLLPEMFNTGFSMQAASLAEDADGPTLQWMRQMAAAHNTVLAGSLVFKEGARITNRFVAMDANGIISHYDKRHLFRMGNEHETFSAGEQQVTFNLAGWRIRPLVCYDLRFPVWSRNTLPDGPLATDLMLYVANWPSVRTGVWQLLLQARAAENQCFVAGINRVGVDGVGVPYPGDSLIVDALGNVLSRGLGEEQVISQILDGDELMAYRQRFPAWMDADTFSL